MLPVLTEKLFWFLKPSWQHKIANFATANEAASNDWVRLLRELGSLQLNLKFLGQPFIVVIQESNPLTASLNDSSV